MHRKQPNSNCRRTLLALLLVGLVAAPLTAKSKKQAAVATPSSPQRVWPPPPQKPRIRLLQVIQGEGDVVVKKKRGLLSRLVAEREDSRFLRFARPHALAGDRRGRLYVADTYLAALFVLDPSGRSFQIFAADSDVGLRVPVGVAVDSSDRVWVADSGLRSVLCFDAAEKLLLMFGSDPGAGPEPVPALQRPAGIAVDEFRQRVFVSDSKLNQIFVFGTDGKYLTRFGGPGSEPGKFSFPGALAVARDGRLLVVDTMNARVQVFDPDFKLVKVVGTRGDTPGNFGRPKGVALDSQGHIYVTDGWFHNFQIFGHDAREADPNTLSALLFVGRHGLKAGEFQVPGGIYIDAANHIFVADQINGRIQVFEFLGGE